MTKPIIILPVKEQYALQIADGSKHTEFRTWEPTTWTKGQTIWIVATGATKGPRKVICEVKYLGYGEVKDTPEVKVDRYTVGGGEYINQLTTETLAKQGGKIGDVGIFLYDLVKFEEPFTLKSIGIDRTPQKFQYHTEEREV